MGGLGFGTLPHDEVEINIYTGFILNKFKLTLVKHPFFVGFYFFFKRMNKRKKEKGKRGGKKGRITSNF